MTSVPQKTNLYSLPLFNSMVAMTIYIIDYPFSLHNTTNDIRINITTNMDMNKLASIHEIQSANIIGPADNMVNMPTNVHKNYH